MVYFLCYSPRIPTGVPISLHEHAYYADYKNNTRGYIIKMMQELNWETIEERVKRADMIQKAMEAKE